MSDALILEFKGVTVEEYREVNAILGVDTVTGEGDWPDGLVTHIGASSDEGLVVVEVWDSHELQESFMTSRLGPALGQAGLPAPARAEWLSVAGHYTR